MLSLMYKEMSLLQFDQIVRTMNSKVERRSGSMENLHLMVMIE